ncbi:hypothetical protein VTI74DRAFT_11187 [Chaetomium olivicolor]
MSSLPVPSRVALTALRGLVVGTSCTLALIAEDRRRKINNAMRAIENGERIKAAKGYCAGGGALAVAMEEEALWDVGLMTINQPKKKKKEEEDEEEKETAFGQGDIDNTTTTPPGIPSWLWTNTSTLEAYKPPTYDEIVADVHRVCKEGDPHELSSTLRVVLEAMVQKDAPDNRNSAWTEATALLSWSFQENGRIEDAVKLLSRVMARGSIPEKAYLDHDPFTLIDHLLAQDENSIGLEAYQKNVETAIALFLPTYPKRPTPQGRQVYATGRKVLEAAFSAQRLQRIFILFQRCHAVAPPEELDEFTSWCFAKLRENHEYKVIVKAFLFIYAKGRPTKKSLKAIADTVVESVELSHNYRPKQTLLQLQDICLQLSGEGMQMRTSWIMRLLMAHWRQHGNFSKTEELFEMLRLTEGLRGPRGDVYRIMVEIALEAGHEDKAASYTIAASQEVGDFVSDVRIWGVWARFHAKGGDWEEVRFDFETIQRRMRDARNRIDREMYGRIFAPVLKAYAKTHTVRETEEFFNQYVEKFEVPLCGHTVTIIAKHYGAARDVKSLVAWLDYCNKAGCPVDAEFTNSILVRCRQNWNMNFRELRTLFRKLRVLNPTSVDKHTEIFMARAALTDSKYSGKAAKGRLLSLRIDLGKLAAQGKCAQVDDVILAMREALACNRARKAFWIYKRAAHLGLPFSQRVLRLAVQARLTYEPNNVSAVYKMLRDVQANGHDVTEASNYILYKQLGDIAAGATEAEVYTTVQQVLNSFQLSGVPLTELTLHGAAHCCLQAGHFRGAIAFAHHAAATFGGSAGPCFNIHNFKALLAAYAGLVDLCGLRDTISRGLGSRYKEDTAFRMALRLARKLVRDAPVRQENKATARAVIDQAIAQCVKAREKLAEERKLLEEEALKIMRQAAQDQRCKEADFAEIPWLGGGKEKKKAMEETEEKEKKEKADLKPRAEPELEPKTQRKSEDLFHELSLYWDMQQKLERKVAIEASF